jgi:dihydroneopterin aldolase
LSSDRIILKGMRFYGYHGVNSEEKALGQSYLVDLEADVDLTVPGATDRLEDTISYTLIYRTVKSVVEGDSQNLLESVAQTIADRLLAELPLDGVRVRVKKPNPPVKGSVIEYAAVEIYRQRKGTQVLN